MTLTTTVKTEDPDDVPDDMDFPQFIRPFLMLLILASSIAVTQPAIAACRNVDEDVKECVDGSPPPKPKQPTGYKSLPPEMPEPQGPRTIDPSPIVYRASGRVEKSPRYVPPGRRGAPATNTPGGGTRWVPMIVAEFVPTKINPPPQCPNPRRTGCQA